MVNFISIIPLAILPHSLILSSYYMSETVQFVFNVHKLSCFLQLLMCAHITPILENKNFGLAKNRASYNIFRNKGYHPSPYRAHGLVENSLRCSCLNPKWWHLGHQMALFSLYRHCEAQPSHRARHACSQQLRASCAAPRLSFRAR